MGVIAANYFKSKSDTLMPLGRMNSDVSGKYQGVEILG